MSMTPRARFARWATSSREIDAAGVSGMLTILEATRANPETGSGVLMGDSTPEEDAVARPPTGAEFTEFAAKLDIPDLTFIPISALNGDNVVLDISSTMSGMQEYLVSKGVPLVGMITLPETSAQVEAAIKRKYLLAWSVMFGPVHVARKVLRRPAPPSAAVKFVLD